MSVRRPLYHFVISGITQFVLVIAAFLVLLPTGLVVELPLGMLGGLFLYNVLIATLVAVILTSNSLENKPAVTKGEGLVLGHLVGLVLGAFIGSKYGGPLWAILGGAALYFLVGWIGSRISIAADSELAKLRAPDFESSADRLIRSSIQRKRSATWCVYGAAMPALLLVAAIFVKVSGLPIGPYASLLPAARTAIAALSLVSILIPWLRGTRWMKRRGNLARSSIIVLIGLTLSLAPAFYGFLLFVAFGLSLTELILFALTASIAAATWGARAASR